MRIMEIYIETGSRGEEKGGGERRRRKVNRGKGKYLQTVK